MYSIEKIILTITAIVCFISIWFIPRAKADRASFIFLLTQFFTWILGLIAVEFAWLDYPVRELSRANGTSFLFEFFVLPIITVFFILHYPFDKRTSLKIVYYVAIVSSFTLAEVLLERYTMVIEYHSWKWYWTWISMSLVFYIVMAIYKWFYRIKKVFSL
jgi:hypothetical protein